MSLFTLNSKPSRHKLRIEILNVCLYVFTRWNFFDLVGNFIKVRYSKTFGLYINRVLCISDPELERWRSRAAEPRIMTNTEIGPTSIQGWLEIQKVTPFDSGNYTCVPSYAIPAWIQILVLPGTTAILLLFFGWRLLNVWVKKNRDKLRLVSFFFDSNVTYLPF